MMHWDYFLALEQDLIKLSRFVHFSEQNHSTYSIELAHLLLTVSSEIDVVAKILCNEVGIKIKQSNIDTYRKVIFDKFPDICSEKVFIEKYKLEFCPWEAWKNCKNPEWWSSYNKVKHERNMCFAEANLENVLKAFSGLFLLHYFLKKSETEKIPLYNRHPIADIKPLPDLFTLDRQKHHWGYLFAGRKI